MWTFRKQSWKFELSNTYFSNPSQHKPKKAPKFVKPKRLNPTTHVSKAKWEDVQQLLKFIAMDPQEQTFYTDIVAKAGTLANKKNAADRFCEI